MEKEMFNRAKEGMKCIPGGTKEACLIAREFLQNIVPSEHDDRNINAPKSAVTRTDFLNAIRTLTAAVFTKEDHVPKSWACDEDCLRIGKCIFCPGEFQLAGKDEKGRSLSKNPCPHYHDPANI